jgi:hypothetical protein
MLPLDSRRKAVDVREHRRLVHTEAKQLIPQASFGSGRYLDTFDGPIASKVFVEWDFRVRANNEQTFLRTDSWGNDIWVVLHGPAYLKG